MSPYHLDKTKLDALFWANVCFMIGSAFLFAGTLISTLRYLKVL